jgi:DNA primase
MPNKDDVKQAIDIIDYIGSQLLLKPSGRNFKALCPFHQEKSPSFFVSAERQTFKCFGCGEGGDIFTYYMLREGVTFFEALKDLADYAGITLTNFKPDQDYQKKQDLYEIHNLAAKFYHYLLLEHNLGKKALAYLKQDRGVISSQIKQFQLGYAPNSWRQKTFSS